MDSELCPESINVTIQKPETTEIHFERIKKVSPHLIEPAKLDKEAEPVHAKRRTRKAIVR